MDDLARMRESAVARKPSPARPVNDLNAKHRGAPTQFPLGNPAQRRDRMLEPVPGSS
jgi:hypothetical protein